MITEATFVGDRLARLAGGAATSRPEDAPSARLIIPSALGRRSRRPIGSRSCAAAERHRTGSHAPLRSSGDGP